MMDAEIRRRSCDNIDIDNRDIRRTFRYPCLPRQRILFKLQHRGQICAGHASSSFPDVNWISGGVLRLETFLRVDCQFMIPGRDLCGGKRAFAFSKALFKSSYLIKIFYRLRDAQDHGFIEMLAKDLQTDG